MKNDMKLYSTMNWALFRLKHKKIIERFGVYGARNI